MPPSRNDFSAKSFVRRPGTRPDTSIPMRSEAPPPLRQPTRIGRAKTLTRPERSQPQVPLLNPQEASGFSSPSRKTGGWWTVCSQVCTCWAFAPLLKGCGGLKDKGSQQAWREKVTLVIIAALLGAFIGFVTMGLNAALCPQSAAQTVGTYQRIGTGGAVYGINGYVYNATNSQFPTTELPFNIYKVPAGTDLTPYFQRTAADYPACNGIKLAYATSDPCTVKTTNAANQAVDACPLGDLDSASLSKLKMSPIGRIVGYGWEDVSNTTYENFLVLDGNVLNFDPYFAVNPQPINGDIVDAALRLQLRSLSPAGGKDATRIFYTRSELKDAVPCLKQKYFAGRIDKITPGCFISNLFLYVALIVILGLVLIRFLMAIYFSWFMSWRMSSPPRRQTGGVNHHRLPAGAMSNVDSSGAAPWANKQRPPPSKTSRLRHDGSVSPSVSDIHNGEPYTVCLVTCYSEGEEGISNTLSSLAETDFADSRKLLFVVADGMVTGSGEAMSTPDICVGMLEADARFGTPMPMSFVSVAAGKKQHNMAMVYAGHYTRGRGHRVPLIVVVKCGTPEEAKDKKPGNRGKRDSQMILMNFFQRVTYNDRMTPLDFDLFRKIHALMGVTPDFFELCMMVDADTKVYPPSMKLLANCMMHDPLIMGACGETRIANKRASWVTGIQVYEYFISHHMVKAFESVFGGVTCLPGCFSMYRIKAPKNTDNDWVPVIVKPEVTREYSQSTVTTLHQKNLLLLGEDRFLTTLLLRTFPNRKMVFCPQARCRTEVPDTFKMLLSQRRRWINSTIHNLMELVLVRDLCGTFCFSMQFVVFMDLIGTAVLPVAIVLTYALAITYILNPPHSFTEAIPLMLLCAVIGLPAVLVLLATRKVVYVMWMLVYLIALPVWNFALPLYSFWHFDDFSWGETRKVEGEGKDTGHGDEEGAFDPNSVPLRRWEDWERSRLRKLKREERQRRELETQFGHGFHNDDSDMQPSDGFLRPRASLSFSDVTNDADEDRWGDQIGGYNESAPPPLAIVRHSIWVGGHEVVLGQQDMEKMMEQGWQDDDEADQPRGSQAFRPTGASTQRMRFGNEGGVPVPVVPSRYSMQPAHSGPSPASYAPLTRNEQGPLRSGQDRYEGHSSAVGTGTGPNNHTRNRSGGHTLANSGSNSNGMGPLR